MKDFSFTIMLKDEPVMQVAWDLDSQEVNTTPLVEEEWKLPLHFTPNHSQMFKYLEMRCFEPTRPDRDFLLHSVGLESYNPYELVKITKGVKFDDFYWLRFKGDEHLRWEDLDVRKKCDS